jgi:hypothetical protein
MEKLSRPEIHFDYQSESPITVSIEDDDRLNTATLPAHPARSSEVWTPGEFDEHTARVTITTDAKPFKFYSIYKKETTTMKPEETAHLLEAAAHSLSAASHLATIGRIAEAKEIANKGRELAAFAVDMAKE